MRVPFWWVACCCAVLTACGGSPPTGPSRPATLSRTRFLAFGDSITAGEVTAPVGIIPVGPNASQVNPPSLRLVQVLSAAYPTQLQTMLQARYPSQSPTVTNAGRGGESVLEGVMRFPDELASSQADVALILEGVNGLNLVGPDTSTEVIREMVRVAKARGARVFLGAMLPTITGRQRSQIPANLVAYDAKLEQMAGEEGAVFVDLYNALLPEVNAVIGVDGLHPTEVGYKRIADVFFAAIQANLEVK